MQGPRVLVPPENAEELHAYIDRLLNSERFRKTPSLRHLLQYLVDKVAAGDADPIKESVIAVEVFGRPGDFDGRIDNIVRVHAHRLRKALEAYYSEEGAGDKIRFSIPKGSYLPVVHRVEETATPAVSAIDEADGQIAAEATGGEQANAKAGGWRVAAAFFAGGLAIFLVLLWTGWISYPRRSATNLDSLRAAPLAALWKGMLTPGVACVVAYTNPVFLWTETPHNRVYLTYQGSVSVPLGAKLDVAKNDPYVDSDRLRGVGPYFFSDSWTGTGEVAAVHKLTEMFSEADFPLKVIRSRALGYVDMKGANVIFLGSPWANEMQEKFNIGATPLICVGNEKIVNKDRRGDEAAEFASVFDKSTNQLLASYGLFSVLPGVSAGTRIISAAGINTYATFATLDFMTTASGVRQTARKLGGPLPEYFQAVVRTEIIRGDAANSTLVMTRGLKFDN